MTADLSTSPIGVLLDYGTRCGVTVTVVGDKRIEITGTGAEAKRVGQAIRERDVEVVRHLTGEPDLMDLGVEPPHEAIKAFRPFPVGALPEVMRTYVTEEAGAINVDPTLVALPALAVCAATIGGARAIGVKRGWFEPCMLWLCVVAQSGGGKSPAAKRIMDYAKGRDRDSRQRNVERLREYERATADYQRELKRWEKKGDGQRPKEPVKPNMIRNVTQDATVEKLVEILADNPRGVLLHVDELASLLGGFDKYRPSAKAAERAHYLSLWSNEPIMLDRKVSSSAFADSPHVTIYGGIQPDTVRKLLSRDDVAAGLPARFLVAAPPTPAIEWSDREADEDVVNRMFATIDQLAEMEPTIVEDSGRVAVRPVNVYLDRDSRSRFKGWHGHNRDRVNDAEGGLRFALSKMPSQLARLALLLHCVEYVSDEHNNRSVGFSTLERAITLVEWFAYEADRFHGRLEQTREERELLAHAEWIRNQKGRGVTPRELVKGRRSIRNALQAEDVLNELVQQGLGRWQQRPAGDRGGRPTRRFLLSVVGET